MRQSAWRTTRQSTKQKVKQTTRQTTKRASGQATGPPTVSLNVELQQEQGQGEPIKVALLVNSVYFFIESVFILETPDGYRLLAIHQGKLLADETYKTPKGAKIAFLKFFGYKAWEEGVKTQWTPFYPPEQPWLDEKYRITDRQF